MAFNRETITFEWKGKTLKYPLADLKPKEARAGAGWRLRRPRQPPRAGPVIGITHGEDVRSSGVQNGGTRACIVGDNSPAGTVKDGYRKSITPGPFGPICQWEPIK